MSRHYSCRPAWSTRRRWSQLGVTETTTMTETRTDSRWVRTADTSCASGVSDREPGLVDLLYRGHHPQSRTEEEVNLIATSTL
jgi:hypothetical protein